MEFIIRKGVLSQYNGPGGEVVIPEGVQTIGENVFEKCESLTGVTIPEGVCLIGKDAFCACGHLARAVLPGSAATIGIGAFAHCRSLTSVTLPEGVQFIDGWAFSCCDGLTAAVIPETVKAIGERAFYRCTALTEVTIPKRVQRIGDCAFAGCRRLIRVTISEGVIALGPNMFKDCVRLDSVTLPKSVEAVTGAAFSGSSAALLAPHIPISGIDKEDRPAALKGFARLYLEGAEMEEAVRAEYLKYIRNQKRKLYPLAVQQVEVLRLLFAARLVARKDVGALLEECGRQRNPAAMAEVLECANRTFQPADPTKEFRL